MQTCRIPGAAGFAHKMLYNTEGSAAGLVRRTCGIGPKGPSGPNGPRRNRQSARDSVWAPAGAAATARAAGTAWAGDAVMAPAGAVLRATAESVRVATAAPMDPSRKPRVSDDMDVYLRGSQAAAGVAAGSGEFGVMATHPASWSKLTCGPDHSDGPIDQSRLYS